MQLAQRATDSGGRDGEGGVRFRRDGTLAPCTARSHVQRQRPTETETDGDRGSEQAVGLFLLRGMDDDDLASSAAHEVPT